MAVALLKTQLGSFPALPAGGRGWNWGSPKWALPLSSGPCPSADNKGQRKPCSCLSRIWSFVLPVGKKIIQPETETVLLPASSANSYETGLRQRSLIFKRREATYSGTVVRECPTRIGCRSRFKLPFSSVVYWLPLGQFLFLGLTNFTGLL